MNQQSFVWVTYISAHTAVRFTISSVFLSANSRCTMIAVMSYSCTMIAVMSYIYTMIAVISYIYKMTAVISYIYTCSFCLATKFARMVTLPVIVGGSSAVVDAELRNPGFRLCATFLFQQRCRITVSSEWH